MHYSVFTPVCLYQHTTDFLPKRSYLKVLSALQISFTCECAPRVTTTGHLCVALKCTCHQSAMEATILFHAPFFGLLVVREGLSLGKAPCLVLCLSQVKWVDQDQENRDAFFLKQHHICPMVVVLQLCHIHFNVDELQYQTWTGGVLFLHLQIKVSIAFDNSFLGISCSLKGVCPGDLPLSPNRLKTDIIHSHKMAAYTVCMWQIHFKKNNNNWFCLFLDFLVLCTPTVFTRERREVFENHQY